MIADAIVFSTCSFLGNIGVAITGFGMAIIYLFFWQIFALGGYGDDFKFAVFIQSLALASVQPILLYKANVRKHASRRMLKYFVPITVVSTPLGQLTSEYVSVEMVQIVGGILVCLVSIREVVLKKTLYFPCLFRKDEDNTEGDGGKDSQDATDRTSPTNGTKDERKENCSLQEGETNNCDAPKQIPSGKTEDVEMLLGNAQDGLEDPEKDVIVLDSDESIVLNTDKDVQEQLEELASTKSKSVELPALGSSAIFWTLVAGFASGYLGGLCGIRGPPLILYFLYPPFPVSFTKKAQRATGVSITAINVSMRLIYYAAGRNETYFDGDDWYMYLSVALSSLLGVWIGTLLFKRLKDHKDSIRAVLTVMLVLCGASLLISSFAL